MGNVYGMHQEGAAGKTTRYYYVTSAADDASILVPKGARWFGIEQNAQALALEAHSAARAGIEARDSRVLVAAAASRAMTPVKPGEFINISHQDGSTNIGVFILIFEGDGLPTGTAGLTITDPGV